MRYRPGVVLLLLLLLALPLAAQTTNITGRVTMADGSPLPGVTITTDDGTTAMTDADGRYTIAVPSNRGQVKLTASLSGFQSRTADVRPGAQADFVLRVSFGQEITVGSRAIGAEAEKAVPVDVIPREQLETVPSTETSQVIQKVAPSFNFPRPTISDGTDSVRPATLRGLGPDQVLVMLNGKRRHVSALVNVNNTVGRGSSGADLNAIPASAIDSVEILRDGAAAQYGSDAIAGVLNLVLKSDAQPLKLEVKGGSTTHGDGQTIDTNLSGGWNIGRGALFATFEYRNRYATNRALHDPREQVVPGDGGNNAVKQPNTHWGDSYERDLMSLANLNVPISADGKQVAYGFATWALRHGSHGGNFRRAMDATNWTTIYPLGFLPLIEPRVSDAAANGGVRGEMHGWFYDASLGYGRNKFDFYVRNSLNASLGPTIPPNQTSFYAGSLADDLTTLNFDISRRYNVGLAGPLNVAAGVELRREGYEITAGEPASYIHGGSKSQTGGNAAPGSQVFPGFRPSNEVDVSRNSKAIYFDTEGDVLQKLRLGVAVRYENFSDFGSTTNGKLTARFSPVQWLVLRGAASTGFRAPSLGQSWFSAVSTNFLPDPVTQIVGPFEVGTFPVSSAIARALGAKDLEAEKSRNYSAGVVLEPAPNLEITADYFDIDIEDRIVLSGNLNQPKVQAIIAPFGVNTARFFTNAISTRTKGYDLVVNHQRAQLGGRLDLSAAYSRNRTRIYGEIITPPELSGLESAIFDDREKRRVQCGQPEDNIRLMESYNRGAFNATSRQSRFGEFCSLTINAADNQDFPATWLTDLELSYKWSRYTFAVGAENLFDAFTQRNKRFRDGTTALTEQAGGAGVFTYPINTPFGMNGRFVYSRFSYRF